MISQRYHEVKRQSTKIGKKNVIHIYSKNEHPKCTKETQTPMTGKGKLRHSEISLCVYLGRQKSRSPLTILSVRCVAAKTLKILKLVV